MQKYVITIYPTDKHRTYEVAANLDYHEYEFKDLSGGKNEYIVTISAIIGDAKMKGVTTTRHLPPFPPQNLNHEQLETVDGAPSTRIRFVRCLL